MCEEEKTPQEEIIDKILAELKKRKWTKKKLAEEIGKSPAHVTQVLKCDKNVTLNTLDEIAKALGKKIKITLK